MSVRRRASGRVHYNYFRDYDPAVGRYVQSDPLEFADTMSPYVYVGNNALRFIDPLGLSPADVDRITNTFESVLNGLIRGGGRLEIGWLQEIGLGALVPLLNNIGSTFGASYIGCGDQESVIRDQLEKQLYDDTWKFTQHSTAVHKWGVATSSNPSHPMIIYDPWSGTISTVQKVH